MNGEPKIVLAHRASVTRLDLAFPDVEKSKQKELEGARASLLAQKD